MTIMFSLQWAPFLVVVAIVLGACATGRPHGNSETPTTNSDLTHVGPLRVLLRPQPEVEFMCRLHAQRQAAPNGRILGCYVPREQVIISTPDAHVLLHEFKHYFEGSFHD
jgi:hypothetical protein